MIHDDEAQRRSALMIERDEVTGASYYHLADHLADRPVARSVHVSDLITIDVDKWGQPVGVEVAAGPKHLFVTQSGDVVFHDIRTVQLNPESYLRVRGPVT